MSINDDEYEEAEENNIVLGFKEDMKKKIFEIAVKYKKFFELISEGNEANNIEVFMIPKKITDEFKSNIHYDEIKTLLTDDKTTKEENFNKFKQKLKNKSKDDLDDILAVELKIYGNLNEVESDISEGFDFVNSEFLKDLEFEENLDSFFAHYNRQANNIIIEFEDKSKLIICEENGKKKYHAIESPINKIDEKPLKRTKTLGDGHFRNKRSKNRRVNSLITTKHAKTLNPQNNG